MGNRPSSACMAQAQEGDNFRAHRTSVLILPYGSSEIKEPPSATGRFISRFKRRELSRPIFCKRPTEKAGPRGPAFSVACILELRHHSFGKGLKAFNIVLVEPLQHYALQARLLIGLKLLDNHLRHTNDSSA